MNITRRNTIFFGLLSGAQLLLKSGRSYACMGDGDGLSAKIKINTFKNIETLGYKEFLEKTYTQGYEYSENIKIRGFETNQNKIRLTDQPGQLSLPISINVNENQYCSSIRVYYQINSGQGFCFEAANYTLSKEMLPFIELRVKTFSKNPSIFVVCEIVTDNGTPRVYVTKPYPFKTLCGGTYIELNNT